MSLRAAVLMLVVLMILSACGDGPSGSDKREAAWIAANNAFGAGLFFEVLDVDVTNGVRMSDTQYEVLFDYNIRFLMSLDEVERRAIEDARAVVSKGHPPAAEDWPALVAGAFSEKGLLRMQLQGTFGDFRADETTRMEGAFVHLTKTENGWVVLD